MVLRQSKVGGASTKTTDHPSYMQALEQYPNDSGARSSTDPAPRRHLIQDRFRHHDHQHDEWKDSTEWQDVGDWKGETPWYEDKRGDNQWKDADNHGRNRDRRYR